MKGSHHIIVQNRWLHYEFDIRRNITIIRGDSATGKTTLIGMIRQAKRLGPASGISVSCDKTVRVLEDDWEDVLPGLHDQIVFIDEEGMFIKTEEFARTVQKSDCYFVLVTRESLPNLPYSAEEIYGIHTSGKYHDLKKTYNELYHLYSAVRISDAFLPDVILTEDSGAGYGFFRIVSEQAGKNCVSASGKSNLIRALEKIPEGNILVIGDGAAIGPEMNLLERAMYLHPNIACYLPESFEWMILRSGLVDGKKVSDILAKPEDFVESSEYVSWERYFTALLVRETNGTWLQYDKKKINPNFLNEHEKQAILRVMYPVRI